MTFNRRKFLKAAGAAAGAAQLGFPATVRAQGEPIRIGLLTVKTGALASGGIDMERGLTIFLKEKNYTMGGRKVELTVADTAAVPAQARTKMQELVEREKVHAVVGPLAAERRPGRHEPPKTEPLFRARYLPPGRVRLPEAPLLREEPKVQAHDRH